MRPFPGTLLELSSFSASEGCPIGIVIGCKPNVGGWPYYTMLAGPMICTCQRVWERKSLERPIPDTLWEPRPS